MTKGVDKRIDEDGEKREWQDDLEGVYGGMCRKSLSRSVTVEVK